METVKLFLKFMGWEGYFCFLFIVTHYFAEPQWLLLVEMVKLFKNNSWLIANQDSFFYDKLFCSATVAPLRGKSKNLLKNFLYWEQTQDLLFIYLLQHTMLLSTVASLCGNCITL